MYAFEDGLDPFRLRLVLLNLLRGEGGRRVGNRKAKSA
jgi:hypothetical protein